MPGLCALCCLPLLGWGSLPYSLCHGSSPPCGTHPYTILLSISPLTPHFSVLNLRDAFLSILLDPQSQISFTFPWTQAPAFYPALRACPTPGVQDGSQLTWPVLPQEFRMAHISPVLPQEFRKTHISPVPPQEFRMAHSSKPSF